MKIAVVGSGISGLASAYKLAKRHDVVLYEADSRLGGHTHTVDVPTPGGTVAIDTGFIVFNRRTYPHFVSWLNSFGVPFGPSDMSFSVRSDRRDFEYGSASLNALFSQRRNLFSPAFHRLWRDILRFYRESRELLHSNDEVTLGDYLRRHDYSEAFTSDHILPLVGAVWSSSRQGALDCPARLIVRFFDQHGFLQREPGLEWLTVTGGAREYIRAAQATFRGRVRLACPVEAVSRTEGGVLVKAQGQEAEEYDHVVLACHADQALAVLTAPTPLEQELLGTFRFQANDAVLHTDESLMPRLSRTWASWNYHLDDEGTSGACVTYWMNRLQSLSGPTQYFVTLNRAEQIQPGRVLQRCRYTHPVFTAGTTAAQARHADVINHRGVSYCGAYWRNGFHEDGLVSAIAVCERLGVPS